MASGTTLSVFPEFDLRDQTNLAARWEKYMKRFDNLMAAMDIKDESRKRALLLRYSGEEVNNLFDTLLDKGEEKEIKAQIELGASNKKLRRYSFHTPNMTLTQLLDYARTLHETEQQAKGIEAINHNITSRHRKEADHDDIHKIHFNKHRFRNPCTRMISQRPKRKPATTKTPKSQHCFRCGYSWPHNNARALPRARSVTTAPNTFTLPVCATLAAKSKNNLTRIPPMQYGTIYSISTFG